MVLGDCIGLLSGDDEHLHPIRHRLTQNNSIQQQLQHNNRKSVRCQLPACRPHLVPSPLFSFNTLDLP